MQGPGTGCCKISSPHCPFRGHSVVEGHTLSAGLFCRQSDGMGCCALQHPDAILPRAVATREGGTTGSSHSHSRRCSTLACPGSWGPTIEGPYSHVAEWTRAAGLAATSPVGICVASHSAHRHATHREGREGHAVESVLGERWACFQRCLLLGNRLGILLLPQGIGFGGLGGLHATDRRGRPCGKQAGGDGAGSAPGGLALSSSLCGGRGRRVHALKERHVASHGRVTPQG